MGEIKSVKVDNWGVFFLQKLQNFFNKTDYCDLTLQFRDNSQLKVHRLVLSACTDYFNVLEQTCEMVDDALIMPNELQADVVVPIVNFMYTGTLEFELKMYGKLLRTAKDMNMTVLLKLLEAHRRTMEGVNRMQRPPSPKPLRRRVPTAANIPAQQSAFQQRRILTSPNNLSGGQRRITQTKTISTNAASTSQQGQYRQQIGSTSLIKTTSGNNSGNIQSRSQYGNQTIQETHQTTIKLEPEEPSATSPFEQLRKGYNNNKRPASSTLISPPTKKLNIEDVKEFAEQQRMRKQIAAEYGDDQGEYESSMMEDDIHNDDDDDDLATTSATGTSATNQPSTSRQTHLQHGGTTITINQNEKPPTIVVKDSSNSKMNHAKIIKEVLRQYPHLVKSNKNIKLKIMPSTGDQPQKIIVKKEQVDNTTNDAQQQTSSSQSQSVLRAPTSSQTLLKPMEKQQVNVQQPTAPKVTPAQQKQSAPTGPITVGVGTATPAPPAQKRRIDSKTMHALIALGAENTTGPWLCLRCGVNGRPISIPSYRGFRRHLINTHKEQIDPALCEHCGWRSSGKRELHFHMEVEHKVKTTSFTFPQCLLCSDSFLDTNALNQHMIDAHPDENKQQCIYCNKIFAREMQLYNHMKTYHKKQALEDGIIDYSDEEFSESQDATEVEDNSTKDKKESKIKIISDISLPSAGSIINMESGNIATDVNAQIGIAGDHQQFLGTDEGTIITTEPKFVNVEGNEMILTDEQRQEIMAQLNQDHGAGGVVMVLNEPAEEYTAETTAISSNQGDVESNAEKAETALSTEQEVEAMEEETGNAGAESSITEEDYDDSQIYNELQNAQGSHGDEEGTEEMRSAETVDDKKMITAGSALDESKESIENLEWAENLISEHEMADQEMEAEKKVKENKTDDAINQKLKELTGDWSEDENDEDQQAEAMATSSDVRVPKDSSLSLEDEKNNDKIQENKTGEQVLKLTEEEGTIQKEKEELETNIVDTAENDDNLKDDDPGYTNANADDSKGDDDDLDTLMKNLHKEDVDIGDEEKEEEEEEVPKMEESSTEGDVVDREKIGNIASNEEITKEDSIVSLQDKNKNDDIIEAADDGIPLSREILLDELVKKELTTAKTEDLTAESTEAPASTLAVTKISTDTVKDDLSMEVDELNSKDADVDVKHESEAKGGENSVETVEEVVKDIAATTVETTADSVDVTKPSDRLNSLISEWGEDEEDEQSAPTSAVNTAEDKEQL
ncbi:centrosome-associated zinc finger protein CP190 [Ceratitis capitata]|uniref:(Mediterranean fruit fly) hypothetical protein n=2 Tax=Ceratitis capitata TaxID=7213 RepID=A0A811U1B7_CERCA|nr:centrosome-associated zinc finger protein CP190 [Ceratitis capitata]XP_004537034.1 centrosome-associated zinc finger protein CP190 [Ceratitis capitata]CAD6991867.1 unnamed protein product [Ceratitis capitata]